MTCDCDNTLEFEARIARRRLREAWHRSYGCPSMREAVIRFNKREDGRLWSTCVTSNCAVSLKECRKGPCPKILGD